MPALNTGSSAREAPRQPPLQSVPLVLCWESISKELAGILGQCWDHTFRIDVVFGPRVLALEKQLELGSKVWNSRVVL